jgi:hypothetical protein
MTAEQSLFLALRVACAASPEKADLFPFAGVV